MWEQYHREGADAVAAALRERGYSVVRDGYKWKVQPDAAICHDASGHNKGALHIWDGREIDDAGKVRAHCHSCGFALRGIHAVLGWVNEDDEWFDQYAQASWGSAIHAPTPVDGCRVCGNTLRWGATECLNHLLAERVAVVDCAPPVPAPEPAPDITPQIKPNIAPEPAHIPMRQFQEGYRLIRSVDEITPILGGMGRVVGLDTETDSPDSHNANLVGISISDAPETGVYIPIGHTDIALPLDAVAARVNEFLASRTAIFWNAGFDLRILERHGIAVGEYRDAQIEAVLGGLTGNSVALKSVAADMFGIDTVTFSDLRPRGVKVAEFNMSMLPAEGQVAEYASQDADLTLRVHERVGDLPPMIDALEHGIIPVINRIEDTGFAVDTNAVKAELGRLETEAAETHDAIMSDFAPAEPAFASLTQKGELGKFLHAQGYELELTASGKPSVNKESLDKAAKRDKTGDIARIIHWNGLNEAQKKLRSLLSDVHEDGRVRTSYNAMGASKTGRFSSSKPNIQNIRKPLDASDFEQTIGRNLRSAFAPSEGYYLAELDFASIEFVVMAAMAGEESVVADYAAGIDLHARTAEMMYGMPYAEIVAGKDEKGSDAEKYRRIAKTLNFAIGYGAGVATLAKQGGFPQSEARDGLRRWRAAFPNIARYFANRVTALEIEGYVQTAFGRVNRLHDTDNPNTTALNKVIQGTAADIQKLGLLAVDGLIDERGWRDKVRIVAQTHDSQTLEIHKSLSPEDALPPIMAAMSPDTMLADVGLPPIRVEAQIGDNWGDMKTWSLQ